MSFLKTNLKDSLLSQLSLVSRPLAAVLEILTEVNTLGPLSYDPAPLPFSDWIKYQHISLLLPWLLL